MTSASAAARGSVKTSSSSSFSPSGPAQRHPPVRVFVGGARLILGAQVADGVGQRQRQQPRRRAAQIPVQRADHLVDAGVVQIAAQQPDAAQFGQPGGLLAAIGGQFLVGRTGSAARARRAAGRVHPPDSPASAAGRGWSPTTGSTRATARRAADRRHRRGPARTTGSTCRTGPARAGSRAPTARRCPDPRRRRRRRRGAPPARRCRSSPRGRSGRRCPRSAASPSGSTTAGTAR